MPTDPLKWAMIGCGGIAKTHLKALEDLRSRGIDDATFTAVCDNNEDNAKGFAAELETRFGFKPRVYTDYRQMLEAEKLDVVDICLPHGLHHGVACDAMEAGVNVLCEKPLGITIAASRKMAETAERTVKVLSTAVPYRRLPGQRAVHWVLNESGLIGRPLSFFHQYTQAPRPRPATPTGVPPAMRWRRDRLMSGGGATLDGGFHYCDSIRYFLGDVDTIYAECVNNSSGEPVGFHDSSEDTIFTTFRFKSGVVGMWSWAMSAVGEPLSSIVFYCSEGSISDRTPSGAIYKHLFWRNPPSLPSEDGLLTKRDGSTLSLAEVERLHLECLGDKAEELFPRGLTDGFGFEMWEFAETVRGRKAKVEVDGWEGLKSLAVCEAIYESAYCGQPVKVADVESGKVRAFQRAFDDHWNLK
jgi:UDP-N-acetyl-2-amino-2-deoxyglucuronate dehydrogenase